METCAYCRKVLVIKAIMAMVNLKSRDIEKTNPYKLKVVGPKLKPKVLDLGAKPKKKSRMKAMCSRKGF